MSQSGCLYLVATPIGNLADITLRAIEILKSVVLIAAEDTRHSIQLMKHYQIQTRMLSLNEYNESARVKQLMARLESGEQIALISDAGTPLVNDPGYLLVQACYENGIRVVPVPGPCAAIAAITASGLPTDQFIFAGFLPAKSAARTSRLQALQNETRTMIFYESKHRVIKTLQDFVSVFGGERIATMARELTKTFETIKRSSLEDLLAFVSNNPEQQLGEYALVLSGAPAHAPATGHQATLQVLLKELPLSQAVKIAVKLTGASRKTLYDMALAIQQGEA